jgi:uncharacterized protein (DUF2147 family)
MKTIGVLALLWMMALTGLTAPAAQASPVDGIWLIRDLALNIYDCATLVCGKIVWIGNPEKRTPGKCGKVIVWGLSQDEPSKWSGGSIFDTETDRTYSLNAELDTDGKLHARIFEGTPLFGKTEILTRIAPNSRPNWC